MLGRHAVADRHTGILSTSLLLLLQVLVVGHLLLLFTGHVAWVHSSRTRHARLLSVDISMVYILRSLGRDLGGIDAILGRGRVGRIKASL